MISVNAGRGKDAAWAGRLRRTAIDKRPVPGPVEVGGLGLAGDEQSDTDNHGGRGGSDDGGSSDSHGGSGGGGHGGDD